VSGERTITMRVIRRPAQPNNLDPLGEINEGVLPATIGVKLTVPVAESSVAEYGVYAEFPYDAPPVAVLRAIATLCNSMAFNFAVYRLRADCWPRKERLTANGELSEQQEVEQSLKANGRL
jgi:hypothetical protein